MPGPSNRSTFSPHPLMGLPPRWNVGDLEPSYSTALPVITEASGNMTSNAFSAEANSIELTTVFSDGVTKCDLVVSNDNGTGTFVTVATFTGVSNANEGALYIGALVQNITLQGRAIKVAIQNFSGPGTVTVNCKRLN